jgi:hypothetical protein
MILVSVLAAALPACSSLILPANIQIVPTQYHLSPSDIYAIQRLPPSVGIVGDIHAITASSPEEVQVECGDPYGRGALSTDFVARRKNGRWIVDRASVTKTRPIIVDGVDPL